MTETVPQSVGYLVPAADSAATPIDMQTKTVIAAPAETASAASDTFPKVTAEDVHPYARRKCVNCMGTGTATYVQGVGGAAPSYKAVCECAQVRFEKKQFDNIVFLPKQRVDFRHGFAFESWAWRSTEKATAARGATIDE